MVRLGRGANSKHGASYDILGVIKIKQSDGTDKDFAYSQNLTAAAPAAASTAPASAFAHRFFPDIINACITGRWMRKNLKKKILKSIGSGV